ncbi:conserved hypothetical protein [Candidatus Terasakiella magnetica]|uniref:DUF502 domain-containing protein n=1 Tax=Candidatus Terasakiella magnetica TaxID=1867952 RepID=A0A1C3RC19_9PROT|nr:DUF502 domain-containing protein [Candidatus Terasakiella magnetica]SCA54810.1 conserved hypothetical protein [Candidatus Terasakiella magnetica]
MSDENMHEDAKPVTGLTVTARLRAYFLTGILVTAPISITILLAWLFIDFVDEKVTPLIPLDYNPETYLPFSLPGLGLLIVIIMLTVVGMLTAGFIGKLLVRLSEGIMARMPVISGIYSATKQIFETVLAQKSQAFREAVMIEYPRRGIWAIGFITGTTKGEVQNLTEESCVNIFLPTTPNPTSGFLLFVPKKDLIPLNMSVEQAVKMVISGGIVTPPDTRPQDVQDKPQVSAQTYEEVDIVREKDNAPVIVSKHSEPS